MLSISPNCCGFISNNREINLRDRETVNKEAKNSTSIQEENFQFFAEDWTFVEELNRQKYTIGFIKRAAGFLCNKTSVELREKQNQLLKIVRYSRISKRHQVAASNAISILKETGFPFQGISLQGVSIPFADLSSTILNQVDFTNANLMGVNFSRSSLEETIFNGANFDQVRFEDVFCLNHISEVAKIVLFPDQRRLATLDTTSLYIWDLKTLQLIKKKSNKEQIFMTCGVSLLISLNEKYILRFSKNLTEGLIEIVNVASLKTIYQTNFFSGLTSIFFETYSLKQQDQYLIIHNNQVDVWELKTDIENKPKIEIKFSKTLDQEILCASYHVGTNRLAIGLSNAIEYYSPPDFQLLDRWDKLQGFPQEVSFSEFVFSPTGDALLIAHQNEIYSWNIEQKQAELLISEECPPAAVELNFHMFIRPLSLFPPSSLAYFAEWYYSYSPRGRFCIRDLANQNTLIAQIDYRNREFGPPSFNTNINAILYEDKLIKFNQRQVIISTLEAISTQNKEVLFGKVIDTRFTPDNKQIAVLRNDGTLHHYAILSGKPSANIRGLTEHHTRIYPMFAEKWPNQIDKNKKDASQYRCTLSSDATYLFGEFHTKETGRLRISEVENKETFLDIIEKYLAFALSKNSPHIVFLCDNKLKLWNVNERKSVGLATLPTNVKHEWLDIAISPDIWPSGYVVIGQDNHAKVYQVNWKEEQPLTSITEFSYSGFSIVTFEGRLKFVENKLFYTNDRYQITEYDFITKNKKIIPPSLNIAKCYDQFDVSENGKYLIGATSLHIGLWDIENEKWLDSAKHPLITKCCVRFSPDCRFVSCWGDKKVLVWEIVEHHFHLLWQKPQEFKMTHAQLKNLKNLSPSTAQFLDDLEKIAIRHDKEIQDFIP